MPAGDLVRLEAQALAGDAPAPCGREEAVVAAEQVARGDVGPGGERVRLRPGGLVAPAPSASAARAGGTSW